jgi:iron(III) transport system ATP-binding protein
MITLEVSNLAKQFEPDGYPAVGGVSFSLEKGEILALVGPSGCGKTTTLRMIAGFERPDAGEVVLGARVLSDGRRFVPPERRSIGMVFQDYALFPHLTVFENVAFGLKGRRRDFIKREAEAMLGLVGLERLAPRYPHELSGGERQRVALARALAPRPEVVMLDEPFSNLDADMRSQIREEVRAILKGIGATAIFVTHDQEEALFMGDRLAVFNQGRLEQIGSPEAIFHQPATRFVAEFMGQTDFLPGEVTEAGIQTEIGLLPQRMDLPPGELVELAVRADDVSFRPQKEAQSIILARHFKGALNIYRVRLPSGRLLHAFQPHTRIFPPGTRVHVFADPGHALACFHHNEAVRLLADPFAEGAVQAGASGEESLVSNGEV